MAGAKSWPRDCSDCGEHYRIANFSYRWVHRKTLAPRPGWVRWNSHDLDDYIRLDMHQLMHYRQALATDDAGRR